MICHIIPWRLRCALNHGENWIITICIHSGLIVHLYRCTPSSCLVSTVEDQSEAGYFPLHEAIHHWSHDRTPSALWHFLLKIVQLYLWVGPGWHLSSQGSQEVRTEEKACWSCSYRSTSSSKHQLQWTGQALQKENSWGWGNPQPDPRIAEVHVGTDWHLWFTPDQPWEHGTCVGGATEAFDMHPRSTWCWTVHKTRLRVTKGRQGPGCLEMWQRVVFSGKLSSPPVHLYPG